MLTLSVIVPIYNTQEYLKKCVNSILNQKYDDMEIILVDDGSVDGSSEICDQYECIDHRVKVIHQKNKGCISARRCGLQSSRGEYIGFVDSDDWIAEDMYQILMSIVEEKGCDIVSMGYTAVDGKEQRKEDDATLFGLYEKGKNIDLLLSAMMYDVEEGRRGIHPSLCSKVIRRELLMDIFSRVDENITMGEDAAIFYPCCLKAESIFVMKEYKYFYRIHKNSMCRDMEFNSISCFFSFYQYMQKVLIEGREKYNLQRQLNKYSWLLIIPWLKQIFNLQVGLSFLFPYANVDKNADIILYGAGEVGRAYYKQVVENQYCNIVAWIDKRMGDTKEDILYPEQILKFNYDKIVIAVADKKIADEIIEELLSLGIYRDKILWKQPQVILPNLL